MKTEKRGGWLYIVPLTIIWFFLLIWLGSIANFRPTTNDFLGVLLISNGIQWSDLDTLHNGFYPWMLPFLLTWSTDQTVFVMGAILVALSSAIVLFATFLLAKEFLQEKSRIIAPVVLLTTPSFFIYSLGANSDLLACAFTTFALVIWLRSTRYEASSKHYLLLCLAGILMGISGLFRYHAVLLAAIPCIWILLSGSSRLKSLIILVSGVLLGLSPQVLTNLLGGFGLLKTDTAFNIYKNQVLIDWYKTSAIDTQNYKSIWGVVSTYPNSILSSYVSALVVILPSLLLIFATIFLHASNKLRIKQLSIASGCLFYYLIVTPAYTERAEILVSPILVCSVAVLSSRLASGITGAMDNLWTKKTRSAATVLVMSIVILAFAIPNVSSINRTTQAYVAADKSYLILENEILNLDLVEQAQQIFTDDFNLYFRNINGINPTKNGGWGQISMNGSLKPPELDVSSLRGFVCDAMAKGILMVVWSGWGSTSFGQELSGAFEKTENAQGLLFRGSVEGRNIFSVNPAGVEC